MKCPNCKKKTSLASQSLCNWCETVYCIACRHLEVHNCKEFEAYKHSGKLNLEKTLVKTEGAKIIKI